MKNEECFILLNTAGTSNRNPRYYFIGSFCQEMTDLFFYSDSSVTQRPNESIESMATSLRYKAHAVSCTGQYQCSASGVPGSFDSVIREML